jgi:hypothetical protein
LLFVVFVSQPLGTLPSQLPQSARQATPGTARSSKHQSGAPRPKPQSRLEPVDPKSAGPSEVTQ